MTQQELEQLKFERAYNARELSIYLQGRIDQAKEDRQLLFGKSEKTVEALEKIHSWDK